MNLVFWFKVWTIWACLKWILPFYQHLESPWLPDLEIWCLWAYTIVFAARLLHAYKNMPDLPGPLAWVVSDGPRMWSMLGGFHRERLLMLHEQFGNVVRIGTKALSFNTLHAAKDIYDGTSRVFVKDPFLYLRSVSGEYDIVCTPIAEQHEAYIHDFGPSFSEAAIKEQEALVQSHVNHLISKLKATSEPKAGTTIPSTAANMQDMFILLTGDIAEDLLTGSACLADPTAESSAGKPDTGLERNSLSPWLETCRHLLRTPVNFMATIDLVGLCAEHGRTLTCYLFPRSRRLLKIGFDSATATSKLEDRYTVGVDKKDWLTSTIQHLTDDPPQTRAQEDESLHQVQANVAMLQFFGSEFTATTLTGVFFFLGSNKDVLSELTAEIRSRCSRDDKMTFAKLAKMHYLNAVISETLRLYPPMPMGLPRVATVDATVDGVHVPKGTTVSVNPFVLARSPAFFHEPLQFAPERWMTPTPAAFADDVLDASTAFSLGPRGCVAAAFAFAEMRLVVAKILFHFDVELRGAADGWIDKQQSWFTWEKKPLRMRLKERRD